MELPKELVDKIEKKGCVVTTSHIVCGRHRHNDCKKTGFFVRKPSGSIALICEDGHGMDELDNIGETSKNNSRSASIFNSGGQGGNTGSREKNYRRSGWEG